MNFYETVWYKRDVTKYLQFINKVIIILQHVINYKIRDSVYLFFAQQQ